MAFSLISWLDGAEDCGADSHLSYYGLVIWTLLIFYLFVGLYVLCELYFVPILISMSKRLNMSEDVAGATLMAAGSSAPELFTALIGVLFYADENPGPSTNCASAAFNMCIIIGASIFFSGFDELPIRGYPFIRDCFFYALAVIELYLFWEVITPGVMGWFESFFLVFSWAMYIVVLVKNNRVIKLCVNLMNWMGLTNAEEMLYEQLKSSQQQQRNKNDSMLGISDYSDYDDDTALVDLSEYQKILKTDTTTKDSEELMRFKKRLKNASPTDQHSSTHELLGDMDDDEDHARHFIAMNVEEADTEQMINELKNKENRMRISKKPPKSSTMGGIQISEAPTTTTTDVQIAGTADEIEHHHHAHHHDQPRGKCMKIFHGFLTPFHFCFKWTIPKTDRESSTPLLAGSFSLCILWLAVLTFICVDAAEKLGNCLSISEDVMGLTLLAIGSSLPDCFSSILAAKQGKGEMAVSNALGSNVFDINICIGVSFLLKSIIRGFKGIVVERDTGFELFIAALFLLLAVFMVLMFCCGLVLNKKVGAVLFGCYAVFLGAFCYLLQFD